MRTPLASIASVTQASPGFAGPKPGLALGWILGLAFVKLAVLFITVALTPYEIHRDEFLYLAMGEHLRLWGMDFPPAIALMAEFTRWIFGDTLFAVRFFPAVGGTAILVLGAMSARELGGGRTAQVLAMVALLLGPLFVRPSVLFQPVVWDQFWWTLGFYALIRIIKENQLRWWVLLGIAGGLGLLTKFSILFFGFGAAVGLLWVRERRLWITPGPWLAVAIALAIGSPTLIGQIRLNFPVFIHMTDLRNDQLKRMTAGEFLLGQLSMLGLELVLALAGLVSLLRRRAFRAVGVACVVSFLVVMALQGKPYYIGPIYPVLFAAGAAALDRWSSSSRLLVQRVALAVVVLSGLPALPFGLPILPPPLMARFCNFAGPKSAVTTNRGRVLPLPQDYADMLGWEAQVQAVARVFGALPPEKQSVAALIARNYGEAGALEFYGKRFGLPPRIMLPDNFLLWPVEPSGTTVVTIGIPPSDLARYFKNVETAARFDLPWMVEEERDRPICVADTPIRDLAGAWRRR